MFEDSLIESGGKLRTARGKTSTIAFIVQIVIIGVMILIPLMFTEALPKAMTMTFLAAPPPNMGVVGGVPGGVPGGQMNGVIGGIISSTPTAIPKVATPQRVRVSAGVTQGLKIKNVNPTYPQMAKIARVQGPVVLAAVIGKDGTIQNLHVLSTASPLLNQAAIDAVKEWRYRPYILNGEPVEVDTQITVNFTLSGG